MTKVFALLVVLAGAAHAGGNGLTVEELPDHAIRIDSPFETVQLDPANGGRVRSFVLKSTGDEVTSWDPASRTGGLLDDTGAWTTTPFTATTVQLTPTKYTVALSADSADGVRVTKTLAFNAVTPTIEVTYRIENRSGEALESGSPPLYVRNFIRPGGGKIGTDDLYSLPMSEGVIHAAGKALARHPDTADRLWTRLGESWGAIVNKRKTQGLAIVFEDDATEGLHGERTADHASTFEWTYRAVERGHALETKLLIAPVSGMRAVQHANQALAINVEPDALEVMAMWQRHADGTLVVRDVDAQGKLLTEHPAIDLGPMPISVAARIPVKLPPRATGTVTRELHISNDIRELAVFREAVTSGVSRALQRAPLPAARLTELPDTVVAAGFTPPLTDADRHRGFALYEHDTDTTSHSLTALDFDLAPELRDSHVIGIWPLAAATAIPVTLEPGAGTDASWLAEHVLVRCELEVPAPGRPDDKPFHQLWPVKTVNGAPANQETRLWITLRGRGVAPGDYAFDLHVGPTRVPVRVKVWPVKLPDRPRVNLEMEHAMFVIPGSDVKDGAPRTLDLFLDDMAEHGVNVAQMYPVLGNTLARITIKGSTETLNHLLRTHPEQFQRGPFPELDFSALDPWADGAIAHGMTRVTTNFGDMEKTFPSEDARKWYLRQLRAWLIGRGFDAGATYIKVMDEVTPDHLTDLAKAMAIARGAGWQPFSTYSTVLRYPKLAKAIADVGSVWQFAGFPAAEYAERTGTRDVPESQEVWTYIGHATAARTYQAMRSHGWEVALARLDGFHGHEFYRWPALASAAIVTIDKDRPIDSPAWEGIADGIGDARLLAELIHRLDGRAQLRGHLADTDGPAAKVVSTIIGRDKHAILRVGIRRANAMEVVTVLDSEDFATVARYRAARRAVLEKLAATR